jgi:hypothetical protein
MHTVAWSMLVNYYIDTELHEKKNANGTMEEEKIRTIRPV